MPGTESSAPSPSRLWALLPSLLLPLLALHLGQDSNWDLQNYHLYNPFAWLHGRLTLDIAPAQLQSWYNPILDVPLYLMVSAGWHGTLVTLWLTLPMMLALYLLLRIYPLLSGDLATRTGTLALGVMAATGSAAFSATGASFNDGFVAAGVLGSVHLLLRDANGGAQVRAWFLAGVLAGATAGLKLTAAIYCIGLAAAAVSTLSWRQIPRQLSVLLVGGVLGFALTYGYWGVMLWHLHGNPVFPYFNQIFNSPDASPGSYTDPRFRPQSVVDLLLIPVRLLQTNHRYSELMLRDPRLLLGCIGSALLFLSTFRRDPGAAMGQVMRRRIVAGFFFAALLVWAVQYGIYRYVLPLEMLGCLTAIVALEWLPLSMHGRSLLAVAASVLVALATIHPNWGRTAFRRPMLQVQMPALPPGSLVVLSSRSPLAYAVTAIPDDVPVVSISNNFMHPMLCTNLQARVEQRIADQTGPLWLLRGNRAPDDRGEQVAWRFYGLYVSAPCLPVVTSLGNLRLCPIERQPMPPICTPTTGATHR